MNSYEKNVEKNVKKVIGGKRYDNSTAKFIASYNNGLGFRDFRHFAEDLYLKRTGEFFLVGIGGPASKYYKVLSDGSLSGNDDVIPLSLSEAKEWVEKYANELYEDLFDLDEENNIAFSLLMPENLYDKLSKYANSYDVSMKKIVIDALNQFFGIN